MTVLARRGDPTDMEYHEIKNYSCHNHVLKIHESRRFSSSSTWLFHHHKGTTWSMTMVDTPICSHLEGLPDTENRMKKIRREVRKKVKKCNLRQLTRMGFLGILSRGAPNGRPTNQLFTFLLTSPRSMKSRKISDFCNIKCVCSDDSKLHLRQLTRLGLLVLSIPLCPGLPYIMCPQLLCYAVVCLCLS